MAIEQRASGLYVYETPRKRVTSRALAPVASTRAAFPQRSNPVRTIQMIDFGEHLAATKAAGGFTRYMLDFINETGTYSSASPYTESQVETAFFTSVYLSAALKRVANLLSRVRIKAEVYEQGQWIDAPEGVLINRIFDDEGADILSNWYLNYAIYGMGLVYKVRSRKAVLEDARGTPIYDYADGAVAGLEVLDKPYYELDETAYATELQGVFVQRMAGMLASLPEDQSYLKRNEFVYLTDWNPRNKNRGRSIATIAIHEAVTNASIARWASDYFTRGAMPMIMVSYGDDEVIDHDVDADLMAQKRMFEQQWQGEGASLRAVFLDRKVNVDQVGIEADKVAAPELNKNALEGISAAVGIERDLIVAPEGGTQERHVQMIKQAWNDTIIPWIEHRALPALNRDLGLPDEMRLVADLSDIWELEADRGERSQTELQIFQGALERMNEARERLDMDPDREFGDWLYINGQLMSPTRLKTEDGLINDRLMQQISQLWNDNFARKSKLYQMIGWSMDNEEDGYKFQLVKEGGGGGFASLLLPDVHDEDAMRTQGALAMQALDYEDDGDLVEAVQALLPALTLPNERETLDVARELLASPEEDEVEHALVVHHEGPILDLVFDGAMPSTIPESAGELIEDAGELYASLWFAGSDVIATIQQQTQRALVGALAPEVYAQIEWQTPETFHMTLVYCAWVTDDEWALVAPLIPDRLDTFTLNVGPVEIMVTDGDEERDVIILKGALDGALADVQGRLAKAFSAHRVALSPYSDPAAFKPHITLAYVPKGFRAALPNVRAVLTPTQIVFQRGEYETIRHVVLEANWRARLGTHEEPGSVPHVTSRGDLQEIAGHITRQRARISDLLQQWQKTGAIPSALPHQVRDLVKAFDHEVKAGVVKRDDVFKAAQQALEEGAFDADTVLLENPLKAYLGKAAQMDATDELRAWQKVWKSSRNKALRFESYYIPLAIEQALKASLTSAPEDAEAHFATARKALEDDAPANLTEDVLTEWIERIQATGDPALLQLIEDDESENNNE